MKRPRKRDRKYLDYYGDTADCTGYQIDLAEWRTKMYDMYENMHPIDLISVEPDDDEITLGFSLPERGQIYDISILTKDFQLWAETTRDLQYWLKANEYKADLYGYLMQLCGYLDYGHTLTLANKVDTLMGELRVLRTDLELIASFEDNAPKFYVDHLKRILKDLTPKNEKA